MTPLEKLLVVERDLSCANCNYNLRTLAWSARCPECGVAVRESLPPHGFRFSDWRALKRARLGLGFFAFSVFFEALRYLAFWLSRRYASGQHRAILNLWSYGSFVNLLAVAGGVVLITSPWRSGNSKPLYRLAVFTTSLRFIGLIADSLWILVVSKGSMPPLIDLLNSIAQMCTPLSLLLLWIYLLRLVDRNVYPLAWWPLLATLPACVALLFNHYVGNGFGSLAFGSEWVQRYHLYDLPRYIGFIGLLVMLLSLWPLYRTLNAALKRLRQSGDSLESS